MKVTLEIVFWGFITLFGILMIIHDIIDFIKRWRD